MAASPRHPALDLFATVLHLEDGGAVDPMSSTSAFWKKAHAGLQRYDRLMFAIHADRPSDLHSSTWEMHPGGDEVICLLTGAVDGILEEDDGEKIVELRPGGVCVVPRGRWHRLVLLEPSVLLVINSREGTRHRPVKGHAAGSR